uniref:SFRICE_003696 n=1 Tax=Spodoptera frugiperda TaxID=7108 RepID=A0A2H1VIQ8_SPOFR
MRCAAITHHAIIQDFLKVDIQEAPVTQAANVIAVCCVLLAVDRAGTREWPDHKTDPLLFIANPIEAEVPSHWLPESIVKEIMIRRTTSEKPRRYEIPWDLLKDLKFPRSILTMSRSNNKVGHYYDSYYDYYDSYYDYYDSYYDYYNSYYDYDSYYNYYNYYDSYYNYYNYYDSYYNYYNYYDSYYNYYDSYYVYYDTYYDYYDSYYDDYDSYYNYYDSHYNYYDAYDNYYDSYYYDYDSYYDYYDNYNYNYYYDYYYYNSYN